jgi:hypothetical protein
MPACWLGAIEVTNIMGAVAARLMGMVAWAGAHTIYGILLALYRVDRRVLKLSIAAFLALIVALAWIF